MNNMHLFYLPLTHVRSSCLLTVCLSGWPLAFGNIPFVYIRYGYARFNNLYTDRFAMRGNPKDHTPDAPTIFATQSTHKLLAGTIHTYLHNLRAKGALVSDSGARSLVQLLC